MMAAGTLEAIQNEKSPSTSPAETARPHTEHKNRTPNRYNEMGQSTLALGLRQPMDLGPRALEQVVGTAQQGAAEGGNS